MITNPCTNEETNKIFEGMNILLKYYPDAKIRAEYRTIQFGGILDYYDYCDENKKVLITHHVPHSRFISEKYVGNEMNCFYLTEIGKYLDKFDLVTFGHSHESVYQQFSDRCHAISNPRGYLKAPDTCISYSNSSSNTEGSNDKFQYQLIVEV